MPGTPDPHSTPPLDGTLGTAAVAGGEGVQAAGGLLEIVVSQRDRFRQRAMQLEEEKGEREPHGEIWGYRVMQLEEVMVTVVFPWKHNIWELYVSKRFTQVVTSSPYPLRQLCNSLVTPCM